MADERADYSSEAVAVVGMSCKFPGARNIDEFWGNLLAGVESVHFFSDEELKAAGVSSTLLKNPNYIKARPVIANVELFDAGFFGFSPREAEVMDPQQKLFIECAWEALENAGCDCERYEGRISVYAGEGRGTYLLNNIYTNPRFVETVGVTQIMQGNALNVMATRVSFKLNLKGPSMMVNTACSTSLVSVCLACQSLLNYQCDMALAGGVSIEVPQVGYVYEEGGMQSPDGHCRAFDSNAQGTVFGNGLGIVALKRLEDAIADGDHIRAVIKGSALNNDGSTKIGYTAPSIDGQTEVILEALAMAGFGAETVTYVETHGTGTPLGDPIEITALTQAFRTSTDAKGFCAVGSVKTNVGHLNSAAGIAGLIKAILALENKTLPPSINFQTPNPKIDFENSPFYVNTSTNEWKIDGVPRRAGVSSFGIGGTNAHVILEEAPDVGPSSESRPYQLLTISGKTGTALDGTTRNLAEHLKNHPVLNLADVAYTCQVGRTPFGNRRILVSKTVDEAVTMLETMDSKSVHTSAQVAKDRKVVFMFPGQGAQYVHMGAELYKLEPTFREVVDRCCEVLQTHLELDLREVLYPAEEAIEGAAEQLKQTYITQPALFVIEYALAKLWSEWGVRPDAMVGHSIGEYVAACLAGVFSLEDALGLVAVRGRLMQGLPRGRMLAVQLSEDDTKPYLEERLSIATINDPSSCVVSGNTQSIEALEKRFTAEGIECTKLHTSHAFHSEMMDPILEKLTREVEKVDRRPPSLPFVSNTTGTWISDDDAKSPEYWAKHLRNAVRFADDLEELLKEREQILLEVGPGRTLATFVKRHPAKVEDQVVLVSLPHPKEKKPDAAFMLMTLGDIWLSGYRPDWSGFYAREKRRRLPLPTYPFERQRYWVEAQKQSEMIDFDQIMTSSASAAVPGKDTDIANWFYVPLWRRLPIPPPESQKVEDPALREAREPACVLLFLDECGLGSGLEKRFEQKGYDVVTVKPGDELNKVGDRAYTINPLQRNNYDTLVSELRGMDKLPRTVVHLWGVSRRDRGETDLESISEANDLGFYSLLFLAKALEKQNVTQPVHLDVITSNMQQVTGDEALIPGKSTVLGPAKVIPQEYPHITCRSIDVVLSKRGSRREKILVNRLFDEIGTRSSEPIVAYRSNSRFIQTFEPTRLTSEGGGIRRLKKGGRYLITGGMGIIGLALARHLAKTVKAKLILTGRSTIPARAEWDEWLSSHDESDKTSGKIVAIREIESLGAEVLPISADVTDLGQMQVVLREAESRFGRLNGVIHGAGLLEEGSFQTIAEIGKADCEGEFNPKVQGLVVLDKLLRRRKLDFILLLSSLSTVLGGVKFVAYAAANLFMDAFALNQDRQCSTPWISVDWDAWDFTDRAERTSKAAVGGDEFAMSPEEGLEAFRRILSWDNGSQIVVSTRDLDKRIDQWIRLQSPHKVEEGGEETLTLHSRPSLGNPYVAPRDDVEGVLTDIWGELLGIQGIGVEDDFFELGGDSLLATQLVARLREMFQLELLEISIFEEPTIAALAGALAAQETSPGQVAAIAKVHRQVEQLSPSEARTILQEKAESEE
jgi:acyl transferase domain-containing protein/acyl carrier protein